MVGHSIALYYAWSRPGETGAPLAVIENRFPTLFESRRMLYPRFEELSDPNRFDQSVAGFLDHIMKKNFTAFAEQASVQTGQPVLELERVHSDGSQVFLDDSVVERVDTLVIISFDSIRTHQEVNDVELRAIRGFLAKPGNVVFVCPHHDIGNAENLPDIDRLHLQERDFLHHGDRTIPPQQRFGGLARSLLAGLGVPVENRFGLRPASDPDGSPMAIEIEEEVDRLRLLNGVTTFNLHPHLPHFERLGDAADKMEVLARQRIDPAAPPHPFTEGGRRTFDALLQSRAGVFTGDLLVGDATLWSSTAGGVDSLRRFWTNVTQREHSR
jgi:hypothetical protein